MHGSCSTWLLCLALSLALSRPALGDDAAAPRGTESSAPLESPVDDGYIIGPGDRVRIDLWGVQEQSTEVEVSAEGRLFVPRVGSFTAKGQTLAALRARVRAGVQQVYPNLKVNVALSKPRSFMVQVVGAVAKPGPHAATALSRVSTMVLRAEPLQSASLRRIEVRRVGAVRPIIADLARFTLLGDPAGDPMLVDGDTIYVPLRDFEVEISGAVRRPGSYELTKGRDVRELLELAGGRDQNASKTLPWRHTSRAASDRLEVRSIPQVLAESTPLRSGDRIHVPALMDLERAVVIEGAIQAGALLAAPLEAERRTLGERPSELGAYRQASVRIPFVDGDGVRDLLTKAGGLQPWADPGAAYLLRIAGGGERRRIPTDVAAISAGRAADVRIEAGDTLVIPMRRDSVVVGGAVQHPGLYPFSRDLHPLDYVAFAGGATRTGMPSAAKVVRRRGGTIKLSEVESIEPGDIISVPERAITVAEGVQIALILANLAVSTAALVLSVQPR